jgi:hypothetical protein
MLSFFYIYVRLFAVIIIFKVFLINYKVITKLYLRLKILIINAIKDMFYRI